MQLHAVSNATILSAAGLLLALLGAALRRRADVP